MVYGPNPTDPQPPEKPAHDGGILGTLEQLTAQFLGRHTDVSLPPPAPPLQPVIDTRLAAPPYPEMAGEAPGRYQQEVFAARLNVAGPSTASLNLRTRCDFITVTTFAAGATAPDANDGVWLSLSGTPPAIPTLTAGLFQSVPYRVDAGETLNVHGAEQTISVTLDSTIDLIVIVVANTNVRSPY
jgi:hypothetical protein